MKAARKSRRPVKKRKTTRRVLGILLLVIVVAAAFGAYKVFGPNTGSMAKGEFLYIRTGSSYEQVEHALLDGDYIKDAWSFGLLAEKAGYPDKVKPGKYRIKKGMSNYNIVRLLRSGSQIPVKLVINKLRTKDDFVRLVSKNLEADSNVLRQVLRDNVYLAQFGLDSNTVMCGIMPDTYEFYWNTNADKAFRKIEKNYVRFWTENRKNAAREKGLTPAEITIMASIIEEETNNNTEKPKIASVYLNRLKQGMKLQADPTSKFAFGDFSIRRISEVHTSLAHPYNTYYVYGLPPGPICTPSPKSIDAVLFSPPTKYLYFCANTDGSGTHLFAETFEDHLKNARSFYQMQDARGIH